MGYDSIGGERYGTAQSGQSNRPLFVLPGAGLFSSPILGKLSILPFAGF